MAANQYDAVFRELDALAGLNNPQQSQIQPQSDDEAIFQQLDSLAGIKAPSAPQEYNLGERALQFGRGIAQGAGSLIDLASKGVAGAMNLPAMMLEPLAKGRAMQKTPEEIQKIQEDFQAGQEVLRNTEFANKGAKLADLLAGRDLTPEQEDLVGRLLQTTGEFMTPIPGAGYIKAGKTGLGALGKVLTKEAGIAGGAATAVNTPQLAEEGSGLGVLENMGKAIVGGRVGANPLATVKGIANIPGKTLEGIKNIPAKALSLGAKPNQEVFKLAEKHGVELPFNVGMNSSPQNFLANNFLKTMFVSKNYKKALESADESMVRAVKKNIDTLGPSQLKPSEASGEYRKLLKEQEKEAESVSRELYDKAASLLKPTDKVVPKHTISSIESMRELLNRDIKSPATKKVAAKIAELADSWGINPTGPKIGFGKKPKEISATNTKLLEENPEFINKILDNIQHNKTPISIERLNGVRKELGTITGHDPDIKGVEAYLNRLKSDITKDIEGSANKEFVSAWKGANKVFKNAVADRFRTDMARSIMTGELPVESFNLMSNAKNIRELERIAGESPKSKEVFDALKKAKVRDIFSTTLKEEGLSTANFVNLFKKEKGEETLQALLGPKTYKDMSEISEIALEFKKSNRELLNTSGTAMASADINRLEKLVKTGFGVMLGTPIVGLPGAIGTAATPYLVSKMVANPRIVAKARAYAIARQQGNTKYAQTILNELNKMTEPAARAALIAAEKELSSKEKKEK